MIEKKQITTLMLVILIIAAIGNSVPNKNSCCDNNHEGPVPKIIDSAEKSKEYNWKKQCYIRAVFGCSSKQVILKVLQYSLENTFAGVFFLIELHVWPATL